MLQNRMVLACGALAVGLIQAWDSNALQAGAFAQILIVAGIVVPVTAIAAPVERAVRLMALILGAVLLTWARMISPVSLNAIHLGLFPAALYILFVSRWDRLQPTTQGEMGTATRPDAPSR